jgi:hypothetical protein
MLARIGLALLVMLPLAIVGGCLHAASRAALWAAKRAECAFNAVFAWAEDRQDI